MGIRRFLLTLLYVGYLVQVGLMLLVLPWSRAWSGLVLELPLEFGVFLDTPAVRGLISSFGALHLLLVLIEIGRGGPFRRHESDPG